MWNGIRKLYHRLSIRGKLLFWFVISLLSIPITVGTYTLYSFYRLFAKEYAQFLEANFSASLRGFIRDTEKDLKILSSALFSPLVRKEVFRGRIDEDLLKLFSSAMEGVDIEGFFVLSPRGYILQASAMGLEE